MSDHEALAELLTAAIERFRDEVGDDYEDEDLAWTLVRVMAEKGMA
ncbi:hypothetical protein [Streptomyces laurentii]